MASSFPLAIAIATRGAPTAARSSHASRNTTLAGSSSSFVLPARSRFCGSQLIARTSHLRVPLPQSVSSRHPYRQTVEASFLVSAAQYALRVTLALFTLKVGQASVGRVRTERSRASEPSTFEETRKRAEKLEGLSYERANETQFIAGVLPKELSAWKHQGDDLIRRVRLEDRVTKTDYTMASSILTQLSRLIEFSHKGCQVKRETPNCWSMCCGPLRAEVNSEKMRLTILVTPDVPQQIDLAMDIERVLQHNILPSL